HITFIYGVFLTVPLSDAVAIDATFHHWRLGFRQFSFRQYHTGLAGHHFQRLPVIPAFPTCSFPLQLSPSRKLDGPEVFLRTPPDCVRNSTTRYAAHMNRWSCSRILLRYLHCLSCEVTANTPSFFNASTADG